MADEKSDIAPSKFVYRDKFSRNGWLNMLNERLRLAKQLLKDDGVIFVSIDDNEQAYLKVLMDEIFGEENFVASVPCILNPSGRQVNTSIALSHEYLLLYSKNNFILNELDNEYVETNLGEVYNKRDLEILKDEKGVYILQYTLENQSRKFNIENRPNLYFPIYINIDETNNFYPSIAKTNKTIDKIYPKIVANVQYVWRWSKEKINSSTNELVILKEKKGFKIYPKKRKISWIFKTFIKGNKFNNKSGNLLLKSIIGLIKNEFNTAKPIELVKLILKLHRNKNARILDFFAGSGTTGHAVMELNKEDNGNRTYTLVTNNENNIGYDVCYERLYRINNGIGTKSETFEWTNKNKSYKQNLNVFSIDYYDTSILKKDDNDSITKIKKALAKEIEEFGITPSTNFNVDIYYDLLSLKPVKRDVSNAK